MQSNQNQKFDNISMFSRNTFEEKNFDSNNEEKNYQTPFYNFPVQLSSQQNNEDNHNTLQEISNNFSNRNKNYFTNKSGESEQSISKKENFINKEIKKMPSTFLSHKNFSSKKIFESFSNDLINSNGLVWKSSKIIKSISIIYKGNIKSNHKSLGKKLFSI